MPTVEKHLAICASQIGNRGNHNKYNRWYWMDLNGYSYDPGTAWCACFQSWCANQSGLNATPTASAAAFGTQFPRVDRKDARPGDIVVFNWDGRTSLGWSDHVGIVEWSDTANSGYFGTIEGNTGNSEVARVTRGIYNGYFTAFFRPTYTEDSKPKEVDDLKPVYNNGGVFYRVYNEADGNHMYCIKSEKEVLVKAGWKYEGIAWTAPKSALNPVYRLCHRNNGDHLFTTDFNEADKLDKGDWIYEGVPFFVDPNIGEAVHRLCDRNTGLHFYTKDKNEINNLVSKKWDDEGIAFYVA